MDTSVTDGLPRPRQQRTKESRRKLLEAAVACLVVHGHAGTTTTAVAKRAGLSQGALYKHFPSKQQLLGATAEHLFAELVVGFRLGFAALAAEAIADVEERLSAALELLWQVFRSDGLAAALELYVAARSDEELAVALRPALSAHSDNLLAEAEQLFPELAGHPDLPSVVSGVMSCMQGAAVVAALHEGDLERRFLERVVLADCRRLLETSP